MKIHAHIGQTWIGCRPSANLQMDSEYAALRDIGAFENILEEFNLRSTEREDAAQLEDRLAAGLVEQADPPTPVFAELARRLNAAEIRMELKGEHLDLRFERPHGPI